MEEPSLPQMRRAWLKGEKARDRFNPTAKLRPDVDAEVAATQSALAGLNGALKRHFNAPLNTRAGDGLSSLTVAFAGPERGEDKPAPPTRRSWGQAAAGIFGTVWRGMVALDDHWFGDVLGVICLFGLGYVGLIAAYVFGGQ